MKKLLPVLLGLALLAVVIIFALKNKSAPTEINSENISDIEAPPSGNEAFYTVKVVASQKNGQQESPLVELEGTLAQSKQGDNEYISQWREISKISLMGAQSQPGSTDAFLNKAMITTIDGRDMVHYIDPTFPQGLLTFQLSLLQKIYLGVKPETEKPILRSEKDEVGTAKVQYVFTKEGKNFRAIKTWLQYIQDYIKVDAEDNNLVYAVGPDGRLISVEGTVTLHYRQPASTHFTTYIKVTLKDHKPIQASAPKIVKDSLKKTDIVQAAAEARQAQDQGQMSYEEALKKLDAITEATDSKEVYAVFSALKADVITNPEHASALVSKILGEKSRDASARRRLSAMFGALAQSQSSDIANSLANLATECPDNFCKVQAIVGLNDHPNPSEANAAKMMEIAKGSKDSEISGTALLAAGSIGKKLSSTLPELPRELIAELSDPARKDMQSTVIAAMGNHGAPDYYPTLSANLANKDSNVRSSAVYSMRYLPNEEVNGALINVILKETDKDVTREAFKALQYRNLNDEQYVAVAEKTATMEDMDMQQNAARMLIEAYHDNPKNAEASLNALKEKTKFPEVKAYIESEMKAEPPTADINP